jgi:tetratricopeptide (TPR) repeat protein
VGGVKPFVHVALALTFVGCGGPPPAQPARQEVVVPEETAPPEEDGPGSPDTSTPSPSRSGGDLDACVRGLRDGEGVSNTEGRSFYDGGLAAERAGDLMTARKSYFELIQKHPKSGLMPLAYLAFGEIFRAEAQSDPSKLALAQAAYAEVTKYPPPDNTAYAYAWLRSGDVQEKTDGAAALNAYKKAIEAGQLFPNLPCGQVIAGEAKGKLAGVYSEFGQPNKAYLFFKTIAGEAGAANMMSQLLATYSRQKKSQEACEAARSAPNLSDLVNEYCKKP